MAFASMMSSVVTVEFTVLAPDSDPPHLVRDLSRRNLRRPRIVARPDLVAVADDNNLHVEPSIGSFKRRDSRRSLRCFALARELGCAEESCGALRPDAAARSAATGLGQSLCRPVGQNGFIQDALIADERRSCARWLRRLPARCRP